MAFFDSMKVNLFSDMKGIVTLNGEPVSGAVIKRIAVSSSDDKHTDNFTTQADGRFQFAKMETRSFLKMLPGDSSIYQKVIIIYKDKEYIAWEILAASDRYKGELEDNLDINLSCELTAQSTQKEAAGLSVVSGICTWSNAKIVK